MPQPIVFISYSHKDEIWKDRLLPHLKMLEKLGLSLRDPEIQLIEAQLHVCSREKEEARESLAKAQELIDKMGMHRWDFEVKEIEEQLSNQ